MATTRSKQTKKKVLVDDPHSPNMGAWAEESPTKSIHKAKGELTQDEMFERQFSRPGNYFELPQNKRWQVDKQLGILDWNGRMNPEQNKRYRSYWGIAPLRTEEEEKKINPPRKKKKLFRPTWDAIEKALIEKTLEEERINHPQHYGGDTTYEAIKVIEAWELDFCLGNAVKYISRAGKKNKELELEDLEKAKWYLERKIQQLMTVQIEE